MPLAYLRVASISNGNQGGGDKLQGLRSTVGHDTVNSSAIRHQAGGDRRNWFFLVNQLGGGIGQRGKYMNSLAGGVRGGKNGPGPWGN
tara:strand:+ start:366 stop:629 length:264 start_codon:yes stop_codon:yes gene_type:complete